MRIDVALGLLLAAVVANGLLVGASLDQSIKQLPARRRIGAVAFAAYSQAADLANGIVWYAALGIGTALLTLAAAIAGLTDHPHTAQRTAALACAAVLTVGHSLVTAHAAPTNLSQRHVAADDEQALTLIFDRFQRLQTIRAALQTAALAAVVWALVATVTATVTAT
jgi:hypothetical protein